MVVPVETDLALYYGRWKFFAGDKLRLYDVFAEKGEKTNLAEANPAVVQQLNARLKELCQTP